MSLLAAHADYEKFSPFPGWYSVFPYLRIRLGEMFGPWAFFDGTDVSLILGSTRSNG